MMEEGRRRGARKRRPTAKAAPVHDHHDDAEEAHSAAAGNADRVSPPRLSQAADRARDFKSSAKFAPSRRVAKRGLPAATVPAETATGSPPSRCVALRGAPPVSLHSPVDPLATVAPGPGWPTSRGGQIPAASLDLFCSPPGSRPGRADSVLGAPQMRSFTESSPAHRDVQLERDGPARTGPVLALMARRLTSADSAGPATPARYTRGVGGLANSVPVGQEAIERDANCGVDNAESDLTPRTSKRTINGLKAANIAGATERKGLTRAISQLSARLEEKEEEICSLRAGEENKAREIALLKAQIGEAGKSEGGKKRKITARMSLEANLNDLRARISVGLENADTMKEAGVKLDVSEFT